MTDAHPPIKVTTITDLSMLDGMDCYMYSEYELEHAIKKHREMGYAVTEVFLWKHQTMEYTSIFIEYEEVEDDD